MILVHAYVGTCISCTCYVKKKAALISRIPRVYEIGDASPRFTKLHLEELQVVVRINASPHMWGAPIPLENERRPTRNRSTCDGSIVSQEKFMPDTLVPHVSSLLVLINFFVGRLFYKRYAASVRKVVHPPGISLVSEYYNKMFKEEMEKNIIVLHRK